MNVWQLVAKEIRYRKLHFGLGVLAVLVAVGCLVAELGLLGAHDVRAEQIGASKEAGTRQMTGRLEDDYRKIMKRLGYNVLILHKDEDLGEFYARGHPSTYMPEEYAARLADSRVVTVRHLLPSLQQKIEWPEMKFPIILIGTRGEVPLAHRDPKKPILYAVEPGTVVVGHVVHRRLGLDVDDEVNLLGKRFRVAEVYPARGNEDDVTVWMDLGQAQELVGRPGRINAILALSCFCPGASCEGIRNEITRILPGTQVIELTPQAATRRATRTRAAAHSGEAIAAEEAGRASLRHVREAFAAWIVPLVVVGCTVWVGLLAFSNVRDRRGEIAILRALGLRGRQVFAVFLVKAFLVGLLGAVLGYAFGFVIGGAWEAWEAGRPSQVSLTASFSPRLFLLTLLLAPLLSGLASLVPAVMAARQDPAAILREE